MKETFILLVILFLSSPLIILMRVTLERIEQSIKRVVDWIKNFLPNWLKGEERR